jgi:hypothetical protein
MSLVAEDYGMKIAEHRITVVTDKEMISFFQETVTCGADRDFCNIHNTGISHEFCVGLQVMSRLSNSFEDRLAFYTLDDNLLQGCESLIQRVDNPQNVFYVIVVPTHFVASCFLAGQVARAFDWFFSAYATS